MKATKGKYYVKDCERWVEYEAKVVDLNSDGQPEVFTLEFGGICFGQLGASMNLYIKDNQGQWQPQFGFDGFYKVLKTKNQGYPDIAIVGDPDAVVDSSHCPVWRWNGQEYDIYKQCP